MATYLDRIGEWHRERAAGDRRDLTRLEHDAFSAPPPRGFLEAIRAVSSGPSGERAIALIAELKRRSPSKGDIAPDLDPAEVAREYATGGAACLSVLTDGPHFAGSAEDLTAARAAVAVPVLRKDFTVARADVYDARLMGADAVLLIVALLGKDELAELHAVAEGLKMAVLVEVHDERELERALDVGASLIGVNQRDLHSFEVDRARARRVVREIPAGISTVAESGIECHGDVAGLAEAGFDAVLVGEALLRSADRRSAVAALLGRTVPCG